MPLAAIDEGVFLPPGIVDNLGYGLGEGAHHDMNGVHACNTDHHVL